MFRQTLSTSSRALRSAAPKLASGPQPLLRPQQLRTAAPVYSLRSAFQPSMTRWYSEVKDEAKDEAKKDEAKKDEAKKDEAKKAEEGAAKEDGEADPTAELKKALEVKENEAKEWKDKCLRTVADFRNLQDRTQREVKAARDFAIQKFAKDLIDSVDNLDRAMSMVPKEKIKDGSNNDLATFHEGIVMTENALMQTLQKHGLERVDPEGDRFNPNEHEATFMAPQADKDDGSVFHVQQKGFKLNGRVLRAAKVGVVKNK
ncbi:molecular chaperone GrpE [Geosmithia morbida]|uniref:GrpE protein homolog n=1 Tax=Geosmithia morbida TaxID=1094350 RepID=A0A9P4YVY2_9HYPO|nr:molecular chaperone GrpE [Geosmithia morbida]KAF4123840.1 molecular chaperone GrpE [Geosmithia morbida]